MGPGEDERPERRRWRDRVLSWLLGDDAEWVLGDLEERAERRSGPLRWASALRDLWSIATWVLSPERVGRRRGAAGVMSGRGAARFVDALSQDVRYAVTALRRDIGFTVVVILTLAIGIGGNTAVFSVVHAALLRPLPYEDPDRLVMIWTTIPGRGVGEATSAYANVRDWRAQSRTFEDLATFDPTSRTLTGGEWPEQVMTADVSANLFAVMGVAPAIGRAFTAEEERRRAPVAVVGHELWRRRFGGSTTVAAASIELNGVPFQIVGVMPEGFTFPERDVWLPQTVLSDWDEREARRGTDSWRVVGRLAAGRSLETARAELTEIASRLERAYPSENAGIGVSVVPLHDQMIGSSLRLALWTLFGAVGLVLLVACANAAHVILARGLRRGHEYAVRVALGATTSRLVRLAMTETLLISLAAGALGLLGAAAALDLAARVVPAAVPRLEELGMGAAVLAYAFALSTLTAIAFGLAPALSRARRAPLDGLREGRGTVGEGQRARRVLVIGQLTLAVALVFGANLLIRSFAVARDANLGFEPEDVLVAQLRVAAPEARIAFYDRLIERLPGLPGVEAAGLLEEVLISGAPNRAITVEGRPGEATREEIRIDAVAGDVFRTLIVGWIEGRDFSAADGAGSVPVAIVNETLARRLWPGETAVGKRFHTGDALEGAAWIEVVGVVADMRRQGFERAPIAQAFRPYAQAPSSGMNILVRTSGSASELTTAIRMAIAEIDGGVPLQGVATLEDRLDSYLAPRRSQAFLVGLFSAIALALAAIGTYGLVQYSVTQRAREMGVRIALGARLGGVARLVVGEGLVLAAIGSAAGVGLGLGLSRMASGMLFGVAPFDLESLAVTVAVLLLTTLLACWAPARRASRVDPVVALREW